MKRTAAVLALLIGLVPLPALAQSSIIGQIAGDKAASEKLHFSLLVGMNIAYLRGAGDMERSGGFNIGLSATIKLTDRLSVSPEISPFSRKGVATIPFDTTGDAALDPYFADPAASSLTLTYTDIPVIVRYRLGRILLGAGPFAAFLGAARKKFRAEPVPGEDLHYTREVTHLYSKTDFGLVFEAAWTIAKPRRGMGLIAHLRYQAGFVDVREDVVLADPAAFPSGRNSVIQFYLSFPFVH